MSTFLSKIIALLIGGLLCLSLYFSGRWLLDRYGDLEPQIATVTLIVAITMVLCAILVRGGLMRHGITTSSEKNEIYWRVLHELRHAPSEDPQATTETETIEAALALWASPSVIETYLAARRVDSTSPEIDKLIENVILEMRKDLGSKNFGFREGRLLELIRRS